jgi:hypothetical protein
MLERVRPLRTAKRYSHAALTALWIGRARHLAQLLHRVTLIAPESETPPESAALIRDAIRVLLNNMVALGKASMTHGEIGARGEGRFFVPPEGTTLFGMAERFIDLFGYHNDDSKFERTVLFENLYTLHREMILSEKYLDAGVDFPNFDVEDRELEWYGIFPFVKQRQLARLNANDGRARHHFGDDLLRYNPSLGESGRYNFPDPSTEYEATRPNTPADTPPAEEIEEGEIVEGNSESDKENVPPADDVDDASSL